MQKTREIVVCSVYESRVKDIIAYVKRVCRDDQEVVFKPLEKGTRFDGSKVVFCHSSSSGRLALTDVNDSIYDQAIKDASRTVGKSNVAFVVTDVQKEDVHIKRRTIITSQRTLMSNTKKLLLINNVDDMADDIRDQFTEFLTDINLEPPKRQSWSYSAQFPTIVLLACFVYCIAKLVTLENQLNVLQTNVDPKVNDLIKTTEEQVKLHLEGKIQALNTSFNESTNKHTRNIQNELESLQNSITTVIENQVSNTKSLSDLLGGLNNSLINISEQKAKLEREVMDTTENIRTMNSGNLQLHSQLSSNLRIFKSEMENYFLNMSKVLVNVNRNFEKQEYENNAQFQSISTRLQSVTDKTSNTDEHDDKNSNQTNEIISTLQQLKGELVGIKQMLKPLQSPTCTCKSTEYILTMERKSMEWNFEKGMKQIDLRLSKLESLINNANARE